MRKMGRMAHMCWLCLWLAVPAVNAEHWAFVPARRQSVPGVTNTLWARNPIDNFILAKLEQNNLLPSSEADRATLIRRLSFDLRGLPPALEEVQQFVKDQRPNAFEALVDRYLASPQYGERWARHWLDIVHYGETHGYDKDKPRPNAWPYRDYVIASFNRDKPYSRFVEEQLAADVLYADEPNLVVALGFIAAGPWDFVGHVELPETKTDGLIARYNDRDDMVMNTMSTFQSLTVHCARCHDHKFDPISQKDYYSLQAVFAGVDKADREYGHGSNKVFAAASSFAPNGSFKPAAGVRPVHLLKRGDVKSPGELMRAGALAAIPGLNHFYECVEESNEGSRRAALAKWVTHANNMLMRRSIVNRVWQYHFGRGIVDTPNDFGKMGSAPTHPELLDWLAFWFVDNGESIKKLHRLILTSATWRQSSSRESHDSQTDSDNGLLWRMNRRRLDAEEIRDALLSASGRLDLKMGGPSARMFFFKDDHSPVYDYARYDVDGTESARRSIYRFIVRSVPDPFMDCLDAADANSLVPKRNTTLTALQALSMMNNAFIVRQCEHFAQRLQKARSTPEAHISSAYWHCLGRPPNPDELQLLAAHAKEHGLANACRVLFNSNEFIFVD